MPPPPPQPGPPPAGPPHQPEEITVEFIDSSYATASGETSGFFRTGQEADIMLSGIDFNDTGGPLLFNHPGGIASDGTHLLLADRNNNRVLIWNQLPEGNVPPNLVLGQKNFTTNNPGSGLDQLNWPVSVATDGQRVLVADTYNDRILIWNSFPTQNGEPADLVLGGTDEGPIDRRGAIRWPWAVWTDGEKVIVASTGAGQVLIWNKFPTRNNQPPDIILQLKGKFGTPRSIASDGEHLLIGDHNALGSAQGSFFWKSFPTSDDQMYDFFIAEPRDPREPHPPIHAAGEAQGVVLWGTFTPDGGLIALGIKLHIWDSFPEDEDDIPDLTLGRRAPNEPGYLFNGGDGSSVVFADGKLYISLSNGNKIVVFNSMPTDPDQAPDFAIGSPDIYTNTLETNFIISNPVPASDGEHLFVSSDFDHKLYVWKNLPDESGAKPDIVYELPASPWDNALYGQTLALAARQRVFIWRSLPLDGRLPDIVFNERIGEVVFEELRGVAIDGNYFYLADRAAGRIYVWEGIPDEDSNPKFILTTDEPWRLSSDGDYLAVTSTQQSSIKIYSLADLSSDSQPYVLGEPGYFNLPEGATVAEGHLFVADTVFNRVLIWDKVEDVLSGKDASIVLGADKLGARPDPAIGRDKLFWPAAISFDGSYLWVGEFKFSERILRFSPQP
jgi:hypothetical protein